MLPMPAATSIPVQCVVARQRADGVCITYIVDDASLSALFVKYLSNLSVNLSIAATLMTLVRV